jgi:beta-glucanase (GH16 family)
MIGALRLLAMNRCLFILLAWPALGLPLVAADSAVSTDWKLVWQDEFNGTGVDSSKWEFEVNGRGGGNNELQYYVTNNAAVEGGVLTITARRENYTGPDGTRRYTSSRLRTRHKGDWKYGRIDVRAKLPRGQGLWPAIWMMPTDNVYGGWPNGGEIDIMELVGHKPGEVHGTLHYGDPVKGHLSKGTTYRLESGTFADAFHMFRFEWEPGEMRWYVDGHLFQTQTNWHTRSASFPAPFDQRFHLILNVAVGGRWPGNPDAATVFPQAMTVDYVRIYQKSALAP